MPSPAQLAAQRRLHSRASRCLASHALCLLALAAAGRASADDTPGLLRPRSPVELAQITSTRVPARIVAPITATLPEDEALTPVFAEVLVNGSPFTNVLLLRDAQGQWLASAEDLQRFMLKPPSPELALLYRGQSFFVLNRQTGFATQFDPVLQSLHLSLAASAFAGEALNWGSTSAPLARPGYGGYSNYDLLLQRQSGATKRATTLGGLFELVGFGPMGRLETTLLTPDLLGGRQSGSRRLSRLSTRFTADDPARRASLQLGDVVGSGGLGLTPLRFAGVRYGSNFATQPGFVTSPVLSFAGQTTTPSVVDLYINGQRSRRSEIAPGPFAINDVPVLSGQGEARLVVTDALGRQQVFTESFISTGRLLRAGLTDFSLEAGVQRDGNFAQSPDRYGQAVAVGQWRHGFSNTTTQELRLAASETTRQIGVGFVVGHPAAGVFSLSLLESLSNRGEGGALAFSVQQQLNRRLSLAGQIRLTTPNFQQVGAAPGQREAQRNVAGSVSYHLGRQLNASIGYVEQAFRDQPRFKIMSGQLSRSFGRLFAVLEVQQREGNINDRELSLNLGYRFDGRTQTTARLTHLQPDEGIGSHRLRLQAERNIAGELLGTGWALEADRDAVDGGAPSTRLSAAGVWNTAAASLEGQASREGSNNSNYRLGVRGALGLLDGRPFVSRANQRSFGSINEPALAGLPILVNGQVATVLDAQGRGVLAGLTPYRSNRITADLSDAGLEVLLQHPEVELIPANRAGYRVDLGAQLVYSAILKLTEADGATPIKAGAMVTLEGGGEPFYVADRGEVFITTTRRGALSAELEFGEQRCTLRFELPEPSSNSLPTIGPVPCPNTAP